MEIFTFSSDDDKQCAQQALAELKKEFPKLTVEEQSVCYVAHKVCVCSLVYKKEHPNLVKAMFQDQTMKIFYRDPKTGKLGRPVERTRYKKIAAFYT